MSSRQEEKERRKREREEREAAERASAERRRRLQFVFGGLIVVLLVAAGAAFAVVGLGGKDNGSGGPQQAKATGASIPAAQEADLNKAAAAAGCKVIDAPNEGATHEDKNFTEADYKQNPPTSGNHNPVWYQDGIYAPGDTPKLGMLVHPLEHGRIEVQYKPGTPKHTVDQLETFVEKSDGGYHMLMFQNGTNMPYAVAATAWDHSVNCPTMNDKVFDALRDFRQKYIDKGPEIVP